MNKNNKLEELAALTNTLNLRDRSMVISLRKYKNLAQYTKNIVKKMGKLVAKTRGMVDSKLFYTPVSILICSNDKELIEQLKGIEDRIEGCVFETEEKENALIVELSSQEYDIHIIDYCLFRNKTKDILEASKLRGMTNPCIIITPPNEPKPGIDLLRHNAYDYIDRADLSPGLIEKSIKYCFNHLRVSNLLQSSYDKHREILGKIEDIMRNNDHEY